MGKIFDLYRALAGYEAAGQLEQSALRLFLERNPVDPEFDIEVETNLGNKVVARIKFTVLWYRVTDVLNFKYNQQTQSFTVRNGTRSTPREYFNLSIAEISQSPEANRLRKAHDDRANRIHLGVKEVCDELAEPLISGFLPDYQYYLKLAPDTAKDGLFAKGWAIHISEEDFVDFSLNGWVIDQRPDGYGHCEGTAAQMDYKTKTVRSYGFSSD